MQFTTIVALALAATGSLAAPNRGGNRAGNSVKSSWSNWNSGTQGNGNNNPVTTTNTNQAGTGNTVVVSQSNNCGQGGQYCCTGNKTNQQGQITGYACAVAQGSCNGGVLTCCNNAQAVGGQGQIGGTGNSISNSGGTQACAGIPTSYDITFTSKSNNNNGNNRDNTKTTNNGQQWW